jgi:transcriptional regulator
MAGKRLVEVVRAGRRRTTECLRVKVLNLHERGVVPAAIADTLNVSDRRVKEIVRAA